LLALGVLGGLVGAGALLELATPARASATRTHNVKLHIVATAENDGEIEECG
jgi:hypothetical protein